MKTKRYLLFHYFLSQNRAELLLFRPDSPFPSGDLKHNRGDDHEEKHLIRIEWPATG